MDSNHIRHLDQTSGFRGGLMVHNRKERDELKEYQDWIASLTAPKNSLAAFNPEFWSKGQTEPVFQALSLYGDEEQYLESCDTVTLSDSYGSYNLPSAFFVRSTDWGGPEFWSGWLELVDDLSPGVAQWSATIGESTATISMYEPFSSAMIYYQDPWQMGDTTLAGPGDLNNYFEMAGTIGGPGAIKVTPCLPYPSFSCYIADSFGGAAETDLHETETDHGDKSWSVTMEDEDPEAILKYDGSGNLIAEGIGNALIDCGSSEHLVTLYCSGTSSSYGVGAIVGATDINNAYYVMWQPNSEEICIYKRTSGSFSLATSTSVDGMTEGVLRVYVVDDGVIYVSFSDDTVTNLSYEDTGTPHTGSYVGFRIDSEATISNWTCSYAGTCANQYDETASGGVVAGGSAIVSTIRSYNETGSGGILGGGSAHVVVQSHQIAAGGVIAGGEAYSPIDTYRGLGGILGGGIALVAVEFTNVATGGVQGSDSAIVDVIPALQTLTLTIPAGRVSEDLIGFVVPIAIQLPPTTTQVQFWSGTTSLPADIRLLEQGRVIAYVRMNLKSNEDNTIVVLHGE